MASIRPQPNMTNHQKSRTTRNNKSNKSHILAHKSPIFMTKDSTNLPHEILNLVDIMH